MAEHEGKIINRENVGTGLELGGIIGAIIGLASWQPEVVLFSAGAYIGGKWVKNKK
jgi:hypothetical protein